MKRQFIVNDEILIKENGIKIQKGKKWCPYGEHWCFQSSFRASQSYCKTCFAVYLRAHRSKQEVKEHRHKSKIASIEEVTKRVLALEQLLTDILNCQHCQSRGYVFNHENKMFVCDCRLIAKRKVALMKAGPSCS